MPSYYLNAQTDVHINSLVLDIPNKSLSKGYFKNTHGNTIYLLCLLTVFPVYYSNILFGGNVGI